jgi:hypothetical protein
VNVIRHLVNRFKAIPSEAAQTLVAKTAQGSTELANAVFTGHAYSPYTADNASHRAQFQAKDQGKVLEQ